MRERFENYRSNTTSACREKAELHIIYIYIYTLLVLIIRSTRSIPTSIKYTYIHVHDIYIFLSER